MCSLVSQPVVGLGDLRMTSCCYTNWSSHCFYAMQWCAWLLSVYIFRTFITVSLGLLWSRLIIGSQPRFWTPKRIIPRRSTDGLGTFPWHCAKSLSENGLGAYPNTLRKLFPAETCFGLSVIVVIIIFWPSQTLTSAGQHTRMFGSEARSENLG